MTAGEQRARMTLYDKVTLAVVKDFSQIIHLDAKYEMINNIM